MTTLNDVLDWAENQAAPTELVELAGATYANLLVKIAEGRADHASLEGLWHRLANGWSVRMYHRVAAAELSADLVAPDGNSSLLFEFPNRGAAH